MFTTSDLPPHSYFWLRCKGATLLLALAQCWHWAPNMNINLTHTGLQTHPHTVADLCNEHNVVLVSCWVQSHLCLEWQTRVLLRLSCVLRLLKRGTDLTDIYKKNPSQMLQGAVNHVGHYTRGWRLMIHSGSHITCSHLQTNMIWPWENWEMDCTTKAEHLS